MVESIPAFPSMDSSTSSKEVLVVLNFAALGVGSEVVLEEVKSALFRFVFSVSGSGGNALLSLLLGVDVCTGLRADSNRSESIDLGALGGSGGGLVLTSESEAFSFGVEGEDVGVATGLSMSANFFFTSGKISWYCREYSDNAGNRGSYSLSTFLGNCSKMCVICCSVIFFPILLIKLIRCLVMQELYIVT